MLMGLSTIAICEDTPLEKKETPSNTLAEIAKLAQDKKGEIKISTIATMLKKNTAETAQDTDAININFRVVKNSEKHDKESWLKIITHIVGLLEHVDTNKEKNLIPETFKAITECEKIVSKEDNGISGAAHIHLINKSGNYAGAKYNK